MCPFLKTDNTWDDETDRAYQHSTTNNQSQSTSHYQHSSSILNMKLQWNGTNKTMFFLLKQLMQFSSSARTNNVWCYQWWWVDIASLFAAATLGVMLLRAMRGYSTAVCWQAMCRMSYMMLVVHIPMWQLPLYVHVAGLGDAKCPENKCTQST